jgi:hypothetical protein
VPVDATIMAAPTGTFKATGQVEASLKYNDILKREAATKSTHH